MTPALNINAPVDTLAMDFTREFDAPVEAVFRAHADPELVKQWLGPYGMNMRVDHWEFRTGGGYRYTHTNDNGEFRFNGVFHAVRDDDLIIQTFEFEGAPDMVNLEFMWFEDLGGRTRLRGRSICPNTEAREAIMSSGMEDGMVQSYERLEGLLKTL